MTQPRDSTFDLIDETGDIILEIGKEARTRLLVSSSVLTGSSKVFNRLLGPKFKEGQFTRSSEVTQTIRLLEDHADAMVHMCQLLHGETPDCLLAKDVEAEMLLQLAVLVDKYDCVEKLRLQSQALLLGFLDRSRHRVDEKNEFLEQLVAAAYLLDQWRSFNIATKRLVMETKVIEGNWPKNITRDIIPSRIIDALLLHRLTAREKIAFEFADLALSHCSCDHCDIDIMDNLEVAFGYDKWPSMRRTVADSIKCMKDTITRLQEAAESEEICCMPCSGLLESFIEDVKGVCPGICLECVKEGWSLRGKCKIEGHG